MTDEGVQERAVAKVPTGIEGFDDITRGGLPKGRTSLIMGTPGAGKTVFALQSLVSAASAHGRAGIFVAFEENSRDIVANAATFGWDLPELEQKQLFFLDAYLSPTVVQSGTFDLEGILAALEAKAAEMQAQTIVFDAIDVLLTLLDDPAAERREIHRIHEWLQRTRLTGIITAKSHVDDPVTTARFGFMQFLADTVVLLHHRLADRVALRGVRVMKYRGSDFSGNEYPMVIGSSGIEVATFGAMELEYEVSTERVSSGVPDIDAMLGGGYFRGSGVLITGAPGTAKTTLSGSFTDAACRRGERTLYVSFDEASSQIIRNLKSIGLQLDQHVAANLLHLHTVRTEVRSAEEHLIVLQKLIRDFAPRHMVIDPISAFTKSGGHLAAVDASVRLLDFAKARGITVLCTSLVGGAQALGEMTDLQISTIADTWIHLSYVIRAGERNRAISIVKSRGTRHSNQVRELVLTSDGATLSDVFVESGEVLMGTARFQKEAEERAQEAERRAEALRRRAEIQRLQRETRVRLEAIQAELAGYEAELARAEQERETTSDRHTDARDEVRRLRGGDSGTNRVAGDDAAGRA